MEVKQQLTWWIRILEHVLNSQLFLLRTANKASEIKKVRQTHNTRKERTEAESVYCLDQNSSFWCVYFQIKKKKNIYISLDFHTELFLSQKKSSSPFSSACPQGSYGQACNSLCRCQNGGSCDPVTGKCLCPPGVQGLLCEDGLYTHIPTDACNHLGLVCLRPPPHEFNYVIRHLSECFYPLKLTSH